jgi:hypothetical protein
MPGDRFQASRGYDMAERTRDEWEERSRHWAKAAPRGRSEDDTFNRMIVAEAGIEPGEAVLDRLKAALVAAWTPFERDRVVPVPNCVRLGLGWKAA